MESSPEGNLSQYEYDDMLVPVDQDSNRKSIHLYESVQGNSDIVPRAASYAALTATDSKAQ